MNQWWNDTNKGKPMYQDTNIHPKLFSCDMRTEAQERIYGGWDNQSSVVSVWAAFFLYCTLCE